MPHTPRIPDVPGDVLPADHVKYLRERVSQLLQLNTTKFPGSQPVSFAQSDLVRLEREDYWVCEKSDGVRVLLFINTVSATEQEVYLIDRHNQFRLLNGFFFPHHENPRNPLRSSILDGELVLDVEQHTGREVLRFLAFDCLLVDGQNVMSRTLDKRYGRLTEWFYKPFKKMMLEFPHMSAEQPFEIKIKPMELSYGIEKVFNEVIPRLQHGNDGLIYTCLQSPYVIGTDQNILKWKPPSENSVDFKLVLRFPPDPKNPKEPDYFSKPKFWLQIWTGADSYEPFDELHVEDDEWERMKATGDQIDDRIVEVVWEPPGRWRMLRFRDDKPNGNHKTIVQAIIQSIKDGVEKSDLLARTNAIRTAWKARQQQPNAQVKNGHAPPQSMQSRQSFSTPNFSASKNTTSRLDLRFGPLQESPYSRVGGPAVVMGFNR